MKYTNKNENWMTTLCNDNENKFRDCQLSNVCIGNQHLQTSIFLQVTVKTENPDE